MGTELHVVVGAGIIGSGVARLLAAEGARVRVVTRSGTGPQGPGIELKRADAADPEALTRLTDGASALYNCANPPYHRWTTDWPPLAHSLLRAAEKTGAVLATMSNLYGYGPCPMPMRESTPLAATLAKGRVRADVWREALAAHNAGRARVTEVRASDFLGATNQSYVHAQVVPAVRAGRTARVLGDPDAPHTWSYPQDIARLLTIVTRDERAWGHAWHAPSPEPVPTRQVVADLCRVAGVKQVRVARMPGLLIRAGGLFSPLLRELPEVAYQTAHPFVMDSTAARTTFGLEPTDWDTILTATLGVSA